jgi:hypothetical protein
MPDPMFPYTAVDDSVLDTLFLPDGTKLLKAAGDPIPSTDPDATVDTAPHLVQLAKAGTSTRASVAAATSNTQLLAANATRKGATIFNDSSADLYLGLGTTAASTSNFTIKLPAGGYYEVPFSFSGEIRGIWSSATGNARISELT